MTQEKSHVFSSDKIVILLLVAISLLAINIVLEYARPVIIPLLIAWLLSYIFGPVVDQLAKYHIPNSIAILLVLLLLAGICFLGGVVVQDRTSAFVAVFPKYHERFTAIAQSINTELNLPDNFMSGINWSDKAQDFLLNISRNFLTFMTNLVLVLVFLVFILLGRPYYSYKIHKAFSPETAERFLLITQSISHQISRYLTVKVLISLVTGAVVWVVLTILRIDFAVTWAALAFFLNFIPAIGSIVASIPPILLALIQFYPNYWPASICLLSLWMIHTLIGNVLEPKIMGEHLNLSPVVMLISLIFWGWLWGFVGALLAVPITAAIMIVCEHVAHLRPISIMMGSGREFRKEFLETKP